MDLFDDLRTRQREYVRVVFEILVVIREALAPDVILGKAIAVNHGAHSTVEHEDTLPEESGQLIERVGHFLA